MFPVTIVHARQTNYIAIVQNFCTLRFYSRRSKVNETQSARNNRVRRTFGDRNSAPVIISMSITKFRTFTNFTFVRPSRGKCSGYETAKDRRHHRQPNYKRNSKRTGENQINRIVSLSVCFRVEFPSSVRRHPWEINTFCKSVISTCRARKDDKIVHNSFKLLITMYCRTLLYSVYCYCKFFFYIYFKRFSFCQQHSTADFRYRVPDERVDKLKTETFRLCRTVDYRRSGNLKSCL